MSEQHEQAFAEYKKVNKTTILGRFDNFPTGLVIGALVSILAFGFVMNKSDRSLEKAAKTHIQTVMSIDKNCNDCHLGASFVNLFNSPYVKGNDNIVTNMMDKAHIKRW